MAKILPFKRPRPGEKHQGKTLCQNGFHKWEICQEKQFDTKSGRLITSYKCQRCGITQTKSL